MGMNIGANDVANIANKSSMVGQAQQLRVDQRVKETNKTSETEQARDTDAEATAAENTGSVGSSSGANRNAPVRRFGQESSNRGSADWQKSGSDAGWDGLPTCLRPQFKSAGTSNAFNVPYWLAQQDEQPQSSSPLANQNRLLNGLRSMLNNEIHQYTSAQAPPYSKRTLREFHEVLSDGTPSFRPSADSGFTVLGERSGLTKRNWQRAQGFATMFGSERGPAEAFDKVA